MVEGARGGGVSGGGIYTLRHSVGRQGGVTVDALERGDHRLDVVNDGEFRLLLQLFAAARLRGGADRGRKGQDKVRVERGGVAEVTTQGVTARSPLPVLGTGAAANWIYCVGARTSSPVGVSADCYAPRPAAKQTSRMAYRRARIVPAVLGARRSLARGCSTRARHLFAFDLTEWNAECTASVDRDNNDPAVQSQRGPDGTLYAVHQHGCWAGRDGGWQDGRTRRDSLVGNNV